MKKKGIWFYGFSGVGKSYISREIQKKIKSSIIVDGDKVRELVSYDLGYSQSDREVQIRRVLGISKIIIESKKYPIISTVWMSKKILNICNKENIEVVLVERDMKKIMDNHITYKNKKNVVGIDIAYDKIKTKKIINSSEKIIWTQLKKLI